MSIAPDMRAGDGDRDRTISRLREAFAEGRLTNDEFEQRMTQANSARTYGELAALVQDLPDTAAAAAPVAVPVPTPAADVEVVEDHSVRNGWASWLGVSLLVNVIYVASWMSSGEPGYYWPIWVMGPWGAAMVIRTLTKRD